MQVYAKGGTLVGGPKPVLVRMLAQGAKPAFTRSTHAVHRQNLGRPARVLAVVHGWMPYLAAGSERMMQHLLDALPREEFEVAVLSLGYGDERYLQEPYEYEGTTVFSGYDVPFEPDIIVTHHGPSARVVQAISEDFPEARVVAVYHNERYDIPDIQDLGAELEVYNTEWVRGTLADHDSGIVVHPPLEAKRHAVNQTGAAVTLVNLQDNKGVGVFYELARRFPQMEFLGVEGTHGKQEFRRDLKNVSFMPTTQDMRDVWRRSRVVLMPSAYESYGMVAAEAQVSGIPVMANPTLGLQECLGNAGIFIPRDNVDDWARTLNLLMTDYEKYRERSGMALLRGQELQAQTKRELGRFVEEMRGLS